MCVSDSLSVDIEGGISPQRKRHYIVTKKEWCIELLFLAWHGRIVWSFVRCSERGLYNSTRPCTLPGRKWKFLYRGIRCVCIARGTSLYQICYRLVIELVQVYEFPWEPAKKGLSVPAIKEECPFPWKDSSLSEQVTALTNQSLSIKLTELFVRKKLFVCFS